MMRGWIHLRCGKQNGQHYTLSSEVNNFTHELEGAASALFQSLGCGAIEDLTGNDQLERKSRPRLRHRTQDAALPSSFCSSETLLTRRAVCCR